MTKRTVMKEYNVQVFENKTEWRVNDKLHRDDGPAVEYPDGDSEWYLNGVLYTEAEFLAKTQPAKELTVAEIETLLGYKVKIIAKQ